MRTVKINENDIVTVITAGSILLLVLLAVAGFFVGSLRFALSVLAGGFLAIANFYWLRSVLIRAFRLQSNEAPRFAVLRYVVRLTFLAVALFFLLVYCKADVFGLLLGLSVLVFNIIALSFYMISQKEISPMIHPLLFLQFVRGLLEPLHISEAGADAIAYTWLIMALLLLLSLLTTKGLKAVPSGLQNFMEVVIAGIENMVVETMGAHGKPFFPLIATLALFILVSNLIGLIPGFYPPTANINTTAACAVVVFVATHVVGIKEHGFKYIKHFMGPILWLAPMMFFIEVIGHVSRVISLTLRLFGNMNGHELVLMIFFGLAPFLVPLPMMLMGVLVSFIQAFVFMLLAMIYIQGSMEEAH